MNRWYAWVDDQMYGPYAPEQLSEFVQPTTKLCREGTEEWRAAKDFPELALLLSGVPVELPPSIGWVVRLAGTETVLGPFSKTRIMEMIEKDEIGSEDLVKHTDWDEWEAVGQTKLIAHPKAVARQEATPPAHPALSARATPSPPTESAGGTAQGLPPSPEGFIKVLRESSDQDLMREYRENYKLYARRERKILKEELLARGLIKKTFGLF